MIKEVFKKLKKAENPKEYNSLSAQMLDLLSDVKTAEQLKEVYDGDGLELSDQEAERLYEELTHVRKMRKNPLDAEDLILVSGGEFQPEAPREGPDGWVPEIRDVYRYKNQLYNRGKGYYIKELDGCTRSSDDSWCWRNDWCKAWDSVYDNVYGDERTDIDPGRMSDDFINGVITGGEDF